MGEYAEQEIERLQGRSYGDQDIGENYKAMNEENRKRKENKKIRVIQILKNNNIDYKILSEYHFRIGDFDLWPSTWKWINRKTREKGVNIERLVKLLRTNK